MEKEREWIRRIMISVNKIDGIYEKTSRQMGVKANVTWVLYALDDGMAHSQKQICEEWLIPKTTLNTIIKELERDGYVTLEAISGHRRERNICLTQSGKKYARKALDSLYRAEGKAVSNIPDIDVLTENFENFCRQLDRAFEDTEFGER